MATIVKLKSSDQIRLSRLNTETISSNNSIYEFVLYNNLEKMLEYKEKNNHKWMHYCYTLNKLIKNNVEKVNRFLKEIIETFIRNYEKDVDLLYILRNSSEIIEKNPNILKYSDLSLYDHQKTIFAAIKSVKPKLILYIAPTGTGKTLTPLGLSQTYKVIFVCAARHVGLALARSAISIGKRIAFAFGCSAAEDVRLHYFAAKEYTKDRRSGQIRKVDNTVGDKVEIIICDIRSYLPAMFYMASFNDINNIITYWDEPTITMDYKHHELHTIIKNNWKKNIIPNFILSSATLPKLHELTHTIADFKEKFPESIIHNIVSYDCRKTIPLINNDGYIVMPHYLHEDYSNIIETVTHCEENLSLLRYFDLKEASEFIYYVETNKLNKSSARFERNFASIDDIDMTQIKLYYLKVLKNIIPSSWSTIYNYFKIQRVKQIKFNNTVDGKGNAILVSGSIYEACRYYEIFQRKGLLKCAIVTSYSPHIADTKGETTGEEQETENVMKYETYVKMLGTKTIEQFDKDTKETFKKYPAQMKLLIVVDKLLTGFDAPTATYLYIDKSLQDHGLFQAICRVNRVEAEDKTYGYIVDYKDLFGNIKRAREEYTSGAFEKYDKSDIQGLLKNRFKEAKDELEDLLEQGRRMIEPVEPPKRTPEFIKFFCGDTSNSQDLNDNEQRRLSFYKCVAAIVRAFANIANELNQCGYSTTEADKLKVEINQFVSIRDEIKLASGDYIDLKAYEPAMRHLIDTYINAKESTKISAFDDEDMTLMKLIVLKGDAFVHDLPEGIRKDQKAVAETIEHNLRKVIIEERPTNPKYFDTMAEVLNSLIEDRKNEVKDYEKYLQEIIELAKNVAEPEYSRSYPTSINTKAKQALYDNLDGDENLTMVLDEAVRYTKKHNWRGDKLKEREIINVLKDHLPSKDIDSIFDIIKNQSDY